MKIFISWSSERSEALAQALKEWLPLVLHYAEPWLSRSDIDAGGRWGIEIAKGLESCNFGIICITRDNRDAPWILFEAGALAKSMQEAKVIPLLLDLDKKEISGPLAQFQAKKVERGEIKELILSLNRSATTPIADGTLEKLFTMAWPDLENKIAAIPETKCGPKPSRPEGEILEELVAGIRNLETRLMVMKKADAENLELQLTNMHHMMKVHEEEAAWKRQRERSPRVLELKEMGRRFAGRPGDPLQILVLASFLRDDAPWFYELALELYRAIRSGNPAETASSRKRILDALTMLSSTPLAEEMKRDWKMFSILFDECLSAIEYVEPREQAGAAGQLDPALQALQEAFESGMKK
ncbi:MAG: toll/interleukin-1 receptor domain-containing protein [Terracidiphilus sp.]